MNQFHKDAFRAARVIQQRLSQRQEQLRVELPRHAWDRLERLRRRFEHARAHSWHRAAHHVLNELLAQAEQLQWRLAELIAPLRQHSRPQDVPTLADVYREIVAVREEFEETSLDLEEHYLSVTTDSIAFDGIELGRFEIRLDWRNLGLSQPYRVIALDPHPAASNEEVTHPHVEGQHLCEGDGQAGIRSALAQGRLLDFFLIVCRTLETYAKGSAYVELNHWEGVTCRSCGVSVAPGDEFECELCDDFLCDDCRYVCPICDRVACTDCLVACATCDQEICDCCAVRCSVCGSRNCPDCLKQNLCGECHAKRRTEEHDLEPAAECGKPDGTADGPTEPAPALEATG